MRSLAYFQSFLLLLHYSTVILARNTSFCLDEDFEYTLANAHRSSYVQAFEKWNNDQIENSPDKYKKYGMVNLFARQHWGDMAFECSVRNGCATFPRCDDIFEHLSKQETLKDKSEEELIATTRDVWFALYAIKAINSQMSLVHQLLLVVQENMTGNLARIITDFTPQAHATEEKECAMKKAANEAMLQLFLDIFSMAVSLIPGAQPAAAVLQKIPPLVRMGMQTAELVNYLGIDHQSRSEPEGDDVTRQLTIDITKCGDKGGDSTEENFKRFSQITLNLELDFIRRRENNHDLTNLLNDNMEGKEINTSNNSMVNLMKNSFWPRQDPQLRQKEVGAERNLTKAFVEEFVSFALTQSKCYVKCKVYPEDNTMCPWKKDKDFKITATSLDKYRVCYDDGTVCQMQCWPRYSSDGDMNSEKKLYSLEKLWSHYKIPPTEVIHSSVKIWRKYHNADIPGKVDPFIPSLKRGESSLRLPVCFSNENNLVDLDKTKDSHNFPFICGYFGAETRAVLDKINMKRSSINGELLQEKSKDLFQYHLLAAMRYWSAVKRFVILCELDIRLPHKGRMIMTIDKGADKRCPIVKEAVEGKTELEANQWFCNEWDGIKELDKQESSWIDNRVPFPINHYRRCNDFRQNYKDHGKDLFSSKRIRMKNDYTRLFLADQNHNVPISESPDQEDGLSNDIHQESRPAPEDWPTTVMYGSPAGLLHTRVESSKGEQ